MCVARPDAEVNFEGDSPVQPDLMLTVELSPLQRAEVQKNEIDRLLEVVGVLACQSATWATDPARGACSSSREAKSAQRGLPYRFFAGGGTFRALSGGSGWGPNWTLTGASLRRRAS